MFGRRLQYTCVLKNTIYQGQQHLFFRNSKQLITQIDTHIIYLLQQEELP